MIVRALDTDNDWTFGKGKNDYKAGNDAVAQDLQTRINSFLGDCFFDQAAGIDWFNLLGAKDKLAVQIAVSTVILNTAGVQSILELSMDLNQDRLLTLFYKVKTSFGIVENSSVVVAGNFLLTESGSILTTEGGDPLII